MPWSATAKNFPFYRPMAQAVPSGAVPAIHGASAPSVTSSTGPQPSARRTARTSARCCVVVPFWLLSPRIPPYTTVCLRLASNAAACCCRAGIQVAAGGGDNCGFPEKGVRKMANEHVLTLGDENFEAEVLKSDVPVLVDFWAPWCAPCRMVAPAVEELAGKYAGQVKVGKLNIDDHQQVPQKYGVMSIPTILMFKAGQAVDQVVGAVPKTHLENMVKKAL